MIDPTTIHRRQDGSIDIEFYRQQGLAERRAIMNRAVRNVGQHGMPFAALGIITTVLSAMFGATGTAGPASM